MKRTLQQNKVLHAIIGQLGLSSELKEDLVFQFTGGRSIKSSEMLMEECRALINHLNTIKQQSVQVVKAPAPVKYYTPEEKMRRKIISIAHEMNWKQPSGKADMSRINEFCLQRGHAHKTLNDYTKAELPTLITQFEKLLKDYYAKR